MNFFVLEKNSIENVSGKSEFGLFLNCCQNTADVNKRLAASENMNNSWCDQKLQNGC